MKGFETHMGNAGMVLGLGTGEGARARLCDVLKHMWQMRPKLHIVTFVHSVAVQQVRSSSVLMPASCRGASGDRAAIHSICSIPTFLSAS